jgi:hypothetical protein
MSDAKPTDDDRRRARLTVCWAGSGLEIFTARLATEFARVRLEEREACAQVADDEVGEPLPMGGHDDGSGNVARRIVARKIRGRATKEVKS